MCSVFNLVVFENVGILKVVIVFFEDIVSLKSY